MGKQDTSSSDWQQEKWVTNLSDRELTPTEEDVLAKGLNVAVTPEEEPIVDLIAATNSH